MMDGHPPCVITKSDGLEVDVASGAMTRLAGVSEALSGSTGIHLSIATVPPGQVFDGALSRELRVGDLCG